MNQTYRTDRILSIDIETYCETDLISQGLFRYVSDPSFQIILIGWSLNNKKVKVLDIAESTSTQLLRIFSLLENPSIMKTAYNAMFEIVCLQKFMKKFGRKLDTTNWECTMEKASRCGVQGSLEMAGSFFGLEKEKLKTGKNLISFFCKPNKSRKRIDYGALYRNYAKDYPEKWDEFKEYCLRDVEAERELRTVLEKIDIYTDSEKQMSRLSRKINFTGVKVDAEFVSNVLSFFEQYKKKNEETIQKIAPEIHNPYSTAQIKNWLHNRTGTKVESLSKDYIEKELKSGLADSDIEGILKARQALAKSSMSKYNAILRLKNDDDRIRGLFRFLGTRTGRFTSHYVQLHNLPQQNAIAELDDDISEIRKTVKKNYFKLFDASYGENSHTILSELIRTSFIPEKGKKLIVLDFAQIEARILAWIAKEQWKLDVFNTTGKIYEAVASQMFHIPIEEITKDSLYRKKGKVAELALGYGGSVGALVAMGADNMGMTSDEMYEIVIQWRRSNPKIVNFWNIMFQGLCICYQSKKHIVYDIDDYASIEIFIRNEDTLHIRLPSGRCLVYPNFSIGKGKYGKTNFFFNIASYTGGVYSREHRDAAFVENIVQAVARDLLVFSMLTIDKAGFSIIMHVHDEIVVETDEITDYEKLKNLAKKKPQWAQNLPIETDGFESHFYKK